MVIVGDGDYIEREWDTLATLPKVLVDDIFADEKYLISRVSWLIINIEWDTLATLPKVSVDDS